MNFKIKFLIFSNIYSKLKYFYLLRYINRNDEEIENITSGLRKGRPTPPRLTLLKA